jgi:putative holliday junction resolvase
LSVRIAFDVGTVRIGVAKSDPHGVLASPQQSIPAGDESISLAISLIEEFDVVEVVVGLPKTLQGGDSTSTNLAREWACQLEIATRVPVTLVDERLTTVQAQGAFARSGQKTKQTRSRIDSAAAAILLQSYLDSQS